MSSASNNRATELSKYYSSNVRIPARFPIMKKQHVVQTLRRELQAVVALRHATKSNLATNTAMFVLKQFQCARMARTHADLLASPDSCAAAQFFLNDLYGVKDLTQRDADIERIIPVMERILPLPALQTITEAIVLDALSESLDTGMAAILGNEFSEIDYIAAYRKLGSRSERVRQIQHIQSVGNSLSELVRTPLVGSMLSMMRGPAKIGGLAELHNFLERGFAAFKRMKRPQIFVATIVARESAILENLYAGRAQPFILHTADV